MGQGAWLPLVASFRKGVTIQVDKVHWQEEEMEYTVQFFGD